MRTALFATIWVALTLFVAGEVGKHLRTSAAAKWPWRAWVAGIGLCAVHMAFALAVRYGWNHEAAVQDTAAQAAALYGFSWRGSLYVNYLFLLVWIGEAIWWAVSPEGYLSRGALPTWVLRRFYLVIIANAAVVFVRIPARPLGIVLVAALIVVWARGPSAARASS